MTQNPATKGVYLKMPMKTVVPAEVPFQFWKHLCTLAQAQEVLTNIVTSNVIPMVKIVDLSSSEYSQVPLRYDSGADTTVKFWAIVGADARGNNLIESAGWLYDRLTAPEPGDVISHPPKVKSTVIEGTGMAHLHWV